MLFGVGGGPGGARIWGLGYKGSQIGQLSIPKIKFIWKIRRQPMLIELLKDTLCREDSSTHIEQENIFDKYKLGHAHLKAPFRLFESSYSTSCEDPSESQDQSDRKVRGPYRKYTYDEKMQAVERILSGEDVKIISKEFGIPRRNLLRWKKNGCERKEGGGRPTDCQLETIIYDKIKNKDLTDEKQIRRFAIECSKTTSFKASKGWFVKFCHRFGINLAERVKQGNMDDLEEELMLQA